MRYTKLGRTGLEVSVAGLGCGGNSRIGLGAGLPEQHSIDIVRAALDLGITYFDTAELYGTEPIIGKAIKPAERPNVVIGTKVRLMKADGPRTAPEVVAALDQSLRNLRSDYVDVLMLHGVAPHQLDPARSDIMPALLSEKAKGKVCALGISETAARDADHAMLDRALADPSFEVMMLAFHLLHQNARASMFPRTMRQGVGTLIMFVVRNIFSKPDVLQETMRRLAQEGKVPAELAASADPLGFLVHEAGAKSLMDAAYRFVRHEPGCDVVLFGTSSIAHMQANVASIMSPPLPEADRAKLTDLFGHLVGVGLDLPDYVKGRPPSTV